MEVYLSACVPTTTDQQLTRAQSQKSLYFLPQMNSLGSVYRNDSSVCVDSCWMLVMFVI